MLDGSIEVVAMVARRKAVSAAVSLCAVWPLLDKQLSACRGESGTVSAPEHMQTSMIQQQVIMLFQYQCQHRVKKKKWSA